MAIDVSRGLPAQASAPTNAYRRYVLGMLVLVGAFSWVDRQLLGILMQSIKVEFALTDTQLGLLGGTAFGVFYATVALPMAWLADRLNRRNIIAVSIGFWSAATALCGATTGYASLFLARMGVGIGEGGAAAPAQSMISDLFPPERRGTALAVLYSYIPLGYVAAYSLGGWLNDEVGWRQAFVLFGVPGVLLAVLIRLTVREPERGYSEVRRFTLRPPRFAETLKYFLSQPTLRHLPIAGAAHGIGMAAVGVWLPPFFMRTYGMSSTEIGMKLAMILCVAGLGGTLGGGYIADRLAQRYKDARWYPGVCCGVLAASLPFTLCMYVTDNAWLSLALFFVSSVLNHMLLGPVLAAVQNLAGVSRRAMAAAFYLFVANLISFGLGPVFIGALSDFFAIRFGSDSLRYSLMSLTTGTALLAAIFFAFATRTVRRDLARVEH